ncbi:hypothetical protein R5R35_009463 [Gryllus longicercus]|uniref:HMG box domain-containing protein n=1 Tax=Gryllus longicercus TaxID=2509291 RepID=A0AAN9VV91_9ORTH
MDASYCMGGSTDVDVCRMFDQYLYKRSENLDLSLSVPPSFHPNGGYMGDQTFHTPSFGDEEFDIPPINPHQAPSHAHAQAHGQSHGQSHAPPAPMSAYQPQMLQSPGPDGMVLGDPSGYQQPLYLPEHTMGLSVSSSYSSPQPTYTLAGPAQGGAQPLMMMQQQAAAAAAAAAAHPQMFGGGGGGGGGGAGPMGYGRSPQGASPPAGHETTTTSEDSDDSTPHSAMMAGMKRPSPEPADNGMGKVQKKPKVQKKKKKRDPNEPQKPVSAYALFFRDTQAAIKGQNPNASFGEVSKIVASMWDALDAEHKNVYKKKTEAAKKEYLKALAAYRASLVSKGAGETENVYGGYSGYGGGYSGYSPPSALPSPPIPSQQQQQQQTKPPQMGNMSQKAPMMGNMMGDRATPQQQGMMGSPMGPVGGHMPPSHMQGPVSQGSYMQQVPPHHMSPTRGSDGHLVSSPPPVGSGGSGGSGGPQHPPSGAPGPVQSGSVVQPQQQPPQPPPGPAVATGQQQQHRVGGNACIRHGCPNAAITNSEWEDEYCSNECVVSHCRDVFSSWVASNQNASQNFSTVK